MSVAGRAAWAETVAGGYHSVSNIEVDASRAQLAVLFDRTARQWLLLGAKDPYWSAWTDDAYRGLFISPEQEQTLYASGVFAGSILDLFEQRSRRRLSRGSCLELGCGIGRLTFDLAKHFDHVIGVDVSRGNLEICKRKIQSEGIKNIELRHVRSIEDFDDLPAHDVFLSFTTLQHNSPPVQKAILESCLSKAEDGCIFQTATNLVGYQFTIEDYLASIDNGMEVHAIPQCDVMSVLTKNNFAIREILPDTCLDGYGSFTVFASRE